MSWICWLKTKNFFYTWQIILTAPKRPWEELQFLFHTDNLWVCSWVPSVSITNNRRVTCSLAAMVTGVWICLAYYLLFMFKQCIALSHTLSFISGALFIKIIPWGGFWVCLSCSMLHHCASEKKNNWWPETPFMSQTLNNLLEWEILLITTVSHIY